MLRHARTGSPRRPTVRLVAIAIEAALASTAASLECQALVVLASDASDSVSLRLPSGEIEWP
ncbi:hypothetical protein FHS32_002286 [Streptomyces albaduncus]|uniref:Uncharacterized protein n=1 Tax=Streptomyces griseoloalbus TaxID=67303 RepID=A0A7W8F8T6_9ACTN|nr:hypothetical protein [Streptomyces albaduncus]GGV60849.1 hypothetical protein GCM10010294_10300 [Streptomyces griseoloalbus]GGW26917.1 hypothetical protein GCM10010340_00240 [Streptomyces albaduncus]